MRAPVAARVRGGRLRTGIRCDDNPPPAPDSWASIREGAMADLLIHNGIVITMDPQRRVLENTSVAIAGDRIVEIGPAAELRARHEGASTIDATPQGRASRPGRPARPHGRRAGQDDRREPDAARAGATCWSSCSRARPIARLVAGRDAAQRARAAQVRGHLHLHQARRQRHAHRRRPLHRDRRSRSSSDRPAHPHRARAGAAAVAAALFVLGERQAHRPHGDVR